MTWDFGYENRGRIKRTARRILKHEYLLDEERELASWAMEQAAALEPLREAFHAYKARHKRFTEAANGITKSRDPAGRSDAGETTSEAWKRVMEAKDRIDFLVQELVGDTLP